MNNLLKQRMENENYKLTSIDLFSGPGGLCTGFKWAGILPLIAVEWTNTTVETYSTTHDTDVFVLEKYLSDKPEATEYLERFLVDTSKTLLIHGDITLIEDELIKQLLLHRYGIDSENETIDVVSGGAPCESFSIAGTRTANDDRDDLFNNILRISRTLNSKAILFENVKGMFSKAKEKVKGAIFNYVCDCFEDKTKHPSYRLTSRLPDEVLLKACDYGVPQLRERLFLVAIRSDIDSIFSYPEKEYGPGRKYPYITVEEAIADLPLVHMKEETEKYTAIDTFKSENQKYFVSIMRGQAKSDTINAITPQHLIDKSLFNDTSISVHKGPGHTKKKQDLLALIQERESMKSTFQRLTDSGKIFEYRHLFPNVIYGSRNRRLVNDDVSFTVTSHCLDEVLHPTLNRAVTPREAARLQSFPDWYQFAGPYVMFHGAKEQDKYEQIGDAIPPLLAFALAKELIKTLS